MRDLTYHDEGLKGDDGRINARKLYSVLQTVGQIKIFQNTPFVLDEKYDTNLEEYLKALPGRLPPEVCADISKQREPKNSTKADIA